MPTCGQVVKTWDSAGVSAKFHLFSQRHIVNIQYKFYKYLISLFKNLTVPIIDFEHRLDQVHLYLQIVSSYSGRSHI